MSGFKNFILRGNLVDLAVAVVIGAQFGSLVKQFVQSCISPLLALIGGQPHFDSMVFTFHGSQFTNGQARAVTTCTVRKGSPAAQPIFRSGP